MILLLCSLTASLSFGQISLHYEIHDKLCQKKIEVGFTWVQGVTDLLFFFFTGNGQSEDTQILEIVSNLTERN